jgi:hypothetical protein
MDKKIAQGATPKVDAEYESAIDRYLAEMEHMKQEMDERQGRIERLQAETEAMLAQMKAA